MASDESPDQALNVITDSQLLPPEGRDRERSDEGAYLFDFKRLSFGLQEAVVIVVAVGLLLSLV